MLSIVTLASFFIAIASSNDPCKNDVTIMFPREVDLFGNCTHISGSLTIEDLDPTDCNRTDLPSLRNLRNVTGYLLIKNLYKGYETFSDLLPKLESIGGAKKIPSKKENEGYTFQIIGGTQNLAPPKRTIILENGCTSMNNASWVVSQSGNGSTCEKCGQDFDGFYCHKCKGDFVILSRNDLKSIDGCREIDGGVVLSLPHYDDYDELEESLDEIERIRDYLVIANTNELKDLSFFKSLKSIGTTSKLWDNKYVLAVYNNRELKRLWGDDRSVNTGNGSVLIHQNPALCRADYEAVNHTGSGNSLIGDCNVMVISRLTLNVNLTNQTYTSRRSVSITWSRRNGNVSGILHYKISLAKLNNSTDFDGETAHCGDALFADFDDDNKKVYIVDGETTSYHITDFLSPNSSYLVHVRSYVFRGFQDVAECSNVTLFSTGGDSQFIFLAKDDWECQSLSKTLHVQVANQLKNADYIVRIEENDNDENKDEEKYDYYDYDYDYDYDDDYDDDDDDDSSPNPFDCPCEDNNTFVISAVPHFRDSTTTNTIRKKFYARFINAVTSSRRRRLSVENLKWCSDYVIKVKVKRHNGRVCSPFWTHTTIGTGFACKNFIGKELNVSASIDETDRNLVIKWTNPITTLCGEDYTVDFNLSKVNLISSELDSEKDSFNPEKGERHRKCSNVAEFSSVTCNITDYTEIKAQRVSVKISDSDELPDHLNLTATINGTYSFSIRIEIHRKTTPGGRSWTTMVVGLVMGFVILIIIVCILVYCFYKQKTKRRKRPPSEFASYFDMGDFDPNAFSSYEPDEWEIERERVSVSDLLGEGAFGQVFRGVLTKDNRKTRVAVKSLRSESHSYEKILFLREASVMKEFDSPYIVRLLGIVSQGDPVYVVMELMDRGDLKSFLRSIRPPSESSAATSPREFPLSQTNVLTMATQIATGMAYLTEKKFVHRDLAARNCMVSEDEVVKIGDFGMTRDIHRDDYYRKHGKGPMPVRWMAPESLRDGIFTHCSDVWAFGVVLWEISSLGALPYPGLSNEDVLVQVGKGKLLNVDALVGVPSLLKEAMKRCWEYDPSRRPTFVQILCELPALDGCEAEI